MYKLTQKNGSSKAVTALIMVFLTVTPAAAMLCECLDGGITIESVFDLCCSDLNTQSSPDSTPDSESKPDDPCRDVPLTIEADRLEKSQSLACQWLHAFPFVGFEYLPLELLPAEVVSELESPPPYFSSLDVVRLQL